MTRQTADALEIDASEPQNLTVLVARLGAFVHEPVDATLSTRRDLVHPSIAVHTHPPRPPRRSSLTSCT